MFFSENDLKVNGESVEFNNEVYLYSQLDFDCFIIFIEKKSNE